MIVRHSQNIRPPERKPSTLGLKLKEALEQAQAAREAKGAHQ